jgi:hypothetical protein
MAPIKLAIYDSLFLTPDEVTKGWTGRKWHIPQRARNGRNVLLPLEPLT